MNAMTGFFYVFAAILVFAAVRVITAKNPVHAALFLVLAFFSASALWMLLEAEFLAISLVLVYVGAVMVLFLFVVMMVDLNLDKIRAGFWKNLPVATIVGSLIAFQMSVILMRGFWDPNAEAPKQAANNTGALGKLLYTEYLYPFEVAALILLVAMVAAIALTLRKRKDTKSQNPSEQVRVKAADRVKLVSMPADLDRKQTKSGQ
ncbi:NADH-quinone oxidoreductase subunit J [Limnobacter humi]|uniref:NADH-quinone oxidoreductase subunit J n=1 Tax=Limnobacter humi TaxID=1778671 RepID=A0ABT1WI99_9BURK|nr:NADH-quinone oxidoreductase subunit J [Limnobacter humi]MCQ8897223.1 NADH-quinone oxidoreductase subunit J [Limnobacter humi]